MSTIELVLLAIGLSMDAFAVSVCKGLGSRSVKLKPTLTAGLYFGVFQAAMPMIGYFIGSRFAEQINAYDHWVAFLVLGWIGGSMIYGTLKKDADDDEVDNDISVKAMVPLAFATSIDALAVGVFFASINISNIFTAVSLIGIITFTLSAIGVVIGGMFGDKLKSKAEMAGGVILVLIGLKILIEHLFFPS